MSKMEKFVGTALVSSMLMLVAADASAATSFNLSTSINSGQSPLLNNKITFSLTGVNEYQFSTGYVGSTSTLSNVFSNLYELNTKTNKWTSVWGSYDTFDTGASSDVTGNIMKLTAGTYKFVSTALLTPSSTYTGTYFATLSPVPEPEAYAMMGIGLAAVLLRLRKKNKVQNMAASV